MEQWEKKREENEKIKSHLDLNQRYTAVFQIK